MRALFELAAASVVGIDHYKAGRNGHDGFHWELADDLAVAVVCDGCGSGRHSEVGAKLGAALIGRELAQRIRAGSDLGPGSALWRDVPRAAIEQLSLVARGLSGSLQDAVTDYLLFTIVGVILTPAETVFFSLGDGVFAVNGEQIELGPYPDNAPPYLAYALVDGTTPQLNIERHVATSDLRHVAIGTDGAARLALPAFCENDLFFRNPDGLRRALFLMTRSESGGLRDDATVIALRRRAAAS